MRKKISKLFLCAVTLFCLAGCLPDRSYSSDGMRTVEPQTATAATTETLADGQSTQTETATPFFPVSATPSVTSQPTATQEAKEVMEITIVFDNIESQSGLETSWGYAALVRYQGHSLLFDTGGDGVILRNNLRALGIEPDEIEAVVLSHIHQDHTGGLMPLLEAGGEVPVYGLPSFPNSFQNQVEGAGQFTTSEAWMEISDGVFTTGEIQRNVPEQALVIRTEAGLVVLTGCAHPGIASIVRAVSEHFREPILLVMGGFHLRNASEGEIRGIIEEMQELGVEQVAPSHCTGDTAIQMFARAFGDNFHAAGAGYQVRISD